MRKQQVRRGKDGKFVSGKAHEPSATTAQTVQISDRRPKGWADDAMKAIIARRQDKIDPRGG